MSATIANKIFDSRLSFSDRARAVFDYQIRNNGVYSEFAGIMKGRKVSGDQLSVDEIPLLPVRCFKEAEIKSFEGEADLLFQSSGTESMSRSRHLVADRTLYIKSIEKEFYRHFPKENTSILCYTPGYSENPGSSLIWMLNHLVRNDPSGLSRFLPLNQPLRASQTVPLAESGRTVVLFGAAFGLIDLVESGSDLLPPGSHLIETGGMKTHRRELGRTELRARLSEGFRIEEQQIHSEYGMCELLSQCYAIGGEWFTTPHWVRVTIRDPRDPSNVLAPGKPGKIGVSDLANLYSCSFILTDDRGVMDQRGRFQVLGRWNRDDMRGCNFLIDRD